MFIKNNRICLFSVLLILFIVTLLLIGAKSCANRNNNKTKSGSSSIDTFIINVPSNLSATAITASGLLLFWQDNSNNEDGFEVERSINYKTNYSLLATIRNTNSYSDTDLLPFTVYYYRVRAFNAIGDRSLYSNEIFVVTTGISNNTFTDIAAGGNHTIARALDGLLWVWGQNSYGQLGIEDGIDRNTPSLIGTETDWFMITANGLNTASIKANGTLWIWGYNGEGQIGIGDTRYDALVPARLGSDNDWSVIAVGYRHLLAIKTNNTMYSWGYNYYGELGVGDNSDRYTPVLINTAQVWSKVSADYHTIALKTNGTAWSWGWNTYGQLGLGYIYPNKNIPTQIIGTNYNWSEIATGGGESFGHSLAITTAGTIYSWGNNFSGQLGLGDTISRSTPVMIETGLDWINLSAGSEHSLARKTNGAIYSWGSNTSGQLGLGNSIKQLMPTQIGTEVNWVKIAAGDTHSIGLKTNGTIYLWGGNNFGQLGFGDSVNRNLPCLFGSPSPPLFLSAIVSSTKATLSWSDEASNEQGFILMSSKNLADGYSFLAMFDPDTTFYIDNILTVGTICYYRLWAYNFFGYSPYSEISASFGGLPPSSLLATAISSTAITLSWQDNSIGELGFVIERKIGADGTYAQIVTLAANMISYADTGLNQGAEYYYRITAYNDYGNGTYSNVTSATANLAAPSNLIGSVISYTAITLSWQDNSSEEDGFSIERKIEPDGIYVQIATIGPNSISYTDTDVVYTNVYRYRIRAFNGLGNSVYSNEVQMFSNIKGWVLVDAGGCHAIAKRTNSSIWSWGQNSYGQLGLGNTLQKNTPAQIGTGTSWSLIAAGAYHTVVAQSAYLYSWGRNDYGQLGLGNTINRSTPTQIIIGPPPAMFLSISAGDSHSLASCANYYVWSWGQNTCGQLGLENTINKFTPTLIGSFGNWSYVVLSAGGSHSLAKNGIGSLTTSGTLWSWGNNNSGQLGVGDTLNRTTRIQIGASTNWTQISAGGLHSLAIDPELPFSGPSPGGAASTLWSWGNNTYGQLGLGDTNDRYTPIQIGTTTNWNGVSAGDVHSLAKKAGNTIWAWGNNAYGQLGLGDSGINRLTPTQLGTALDWSLISAGTDFSIAIKTDTTMWAWGINNYGQLGLGDTINRNIPALIGE